MIGKNPSGSSHIQFISVTYSNLYCSSDLKEQTRVRESLHQEKPQTEGMHSGECYLFVCLFVYARVQTPTLFLSLSLYLMFVELVHCLYTCMYCIFFPIHLLNLMTLNQIVLCMSAQLSHCSFSFLIMYTGCNLYFLSLLSDNSLNQICVCKSPIISLFLFSCTSTFFFLSIFLCAWQKIWRGCHQLTFILFICLNFS